MHLRAMNEVLFEALSHLSVKSDTLFWMNASDINGPALYIWNSNDWHGALEFTTHSA